MADTWSASVQVFGTIYAIEQVLQQTPIFYRFICAAPTQQSPIQKDGCCMGADYAGIRPVSSSYRLP